MESHSKPKDFSRGVHRLIRCPSSAGIPEGGGCVLGLGAGGGVRGRKVSSHQLEIQNGAEPELPLLHVMTLSLRDPQGRTLGHSTASLGPCFPLTPVVRESEGQLWGPAEELPLFCLGFGGPGMGGQAPALGMELPARQPPVQLLHRCPWPGEW